MHQGAQIYNLQEIKMAKKMIEAMVSHAKSTAMEHDICPREVFRQLCMVFYDSDPKTMLRVLQIIQRHSNILPQEL